METDNKDLRKLIDELEFKNKRLNDRIFDQMNDKATFYKERTIQALQSSNRPLQASDLSPQESNMRQPHLGQHLARGEPRKSHSPLRNKSGKSVPEQALPSYHIRDELKHSG